MTTIPIRVFILGILWATMAAMAPAAAMVIYWLQHWQDPVDWEMFAYVAGTGALTGALGFWRKYKALLQLPPDLEMARELAQAVKTRETIVETVTQHEHPSATVTTTMRETVVSSQPQEARVPEPKEEPLA